MHFLLCPQEMVCITIAKRPPKMRFATSLSALCFCSLSRTLRCKSQHLKTAPGERAPCCLICNRVKVTISQIPLPNQTPTAAVCLLTKTFVDSICGFKKEPNIPEMFSWSGCLISPQAH